MITLADITRFGVIAIIRSPSADLALSTAGALFRGGILAVEVTYSTPECCRVISTMCAMAPAGAAIGVGTVRTVAELEAAVAAGATYAVSPHVDVESAQRLADGQGAFDGSTGTVERGHEAVSDRLHRATPETLDLRADALIVVFEQVPPATVPGPAIVV